MYVWIENSHVDEAYIDGIVKDGLAAFISKLGAPDHCKNTSAHVCMPQYKHGHGRFTLWHKRYGGGASHRWRGVVDGSEDGKLGVVGRAAGRG